MISPEYKKILQDLNATQYGVALREFLAEEIAELQDVRNIPKTNIEKETLSRQHALKILDKLFGFMEGTSGEKKPKGQYV